MSDSDDIVASAQSRHSIGSLGVSFSSASSASPSNSNTNPAKTAISDCLNAWLNYLQVCMERYIMNVLRDDTFFNHDFSRFLFGIQILNSLCASGTRLAQAIATLEQWGKLFSTL